MMDNFKKKEEKNTLENPESQPKIVRKKTYNCISSDGNVCKKIHIAFIKTQKIMAKALPQKLTIVQV